jgi:hypothetical protein
LDRIHAKKRGKSESPIARKTFFGDFLIFYCIAKIHYYLKHSATAINQKARKC